MKAASVVAIGLLAMQALAQQAPGFSWDKRSWDGFTFDEKAVCLMRASNVLAQVSISPKLDAFNGAKCANENGPGDRSPGPSSC